LRGWWRIEFSFNELNWNFNTIEFSATELLKFFQLINSFHQSDPNFHSVPNQNLERKIRLVWIIAVKDDMTRLHFVFPFKIRRNPWQDLYTLRGKPNHRPLGKHQPLYSPPYRIHHSHWPKMNGRLFRDPWCRLQFPWRLLPLDAFQFQRKRFGLDRRKESVIAESNETEATRPTNLESDSEEVWGAVLVLP